MTNVEQLVRILVAPIDRVEAAAQQVLKGYLLDTAVGVQLETLGKIVGQPRLGLGDDEFRRFIRARIAANRSNGTVEDILKVLSLVLNEPAAQIAFVPQYPASFVVRITNTVIDESLASILVSFLRSVAGGGVRALLEPAMNPDANLLRLDSGPGLDVGHLVPTLE